MDDNNTIQRARRRDRWEVIDKRALLDPTISHRARGLLCWLLAKPDDWIVYARYLHKHTKEGRDACVNALNELIAAGYVEKMTTCTPGKTPVTRYIVHEEKRNLRVITTSSARKPENPACARKPGNPEPENPDPGNPEPENPALQNTDSTEYRDNGVAEGPESKSSPGVIAVRRVLSGYCIPAHSDDYCREWGRMIQTLIETKDADAVLACLRWMLPQVLEKIPTLQWARQARPWLVENAPIFIEGLRVVEDRETA